MKPIIAIVTALMLFTPLATLHGDDPPIVGAIRWDGWYGNGGVVKEAW